MGTSSEVPAARAAVRVLAFLAGQAGPAPAATIAHSLDLPRSTVYHLLAVLAEEGFVVHLPEERRYGLGVSALGLGTAYARQAPLTRLGRPVVARLVDSTAQSAHLAVLHGREVLYLVEERAPGRPALVTDVDVRLPSHLTASGRAILAGLPPAQVRALFPDVAAFTDRTGTGPRTLRELRELLRRVRSRGYAIEEGDVTPGLTSVGDAAVDHTGRPVAGIAVTFRADDVLPERVAELAAAVTRAAAELSHRLGARPPPEPADRQAARPRPGDPLGRQRRAR